jgi:hypothetical protein
MDQESRLSLGDFRTALKRAQLFTSNGKARRPTLEGVRIKFLPDSVRFDAADGYKLAVQRMAATRIAGDGDATAMIRNADVTTLLKALPKTIASDRDDIAITIGYGEDAGRVGSDAITIVHRWTEEEREREQRWQFPAIAGSFPNLDSIIPRDQDSDGTATPHIGLDADHMAAVNKAATVARGSDGLVRWYFGQDGKSPATAIVGTDFLAVVMPMFVDWENHDLQIGFLLGESEPEPQIEADAAS